MPLFPDAATLPESKNPERLCDPSAPQYFLYAKYSKNSCSHRENFSGKTLPFLQISYILGGVIAFPACFLLFFYSAGIRIFSVAIAPYFRSPGSAIVPVPALSALLPNRLLHFSDFFDRPDIPPFPTLSSAWIPPFPGSAIISALASFRCRSYAGIFSFPESIAVRSLEVFSLPVFRFWISERAAFLPLGFCAVVFSVCIRRFCPVTAPFSDLGASRFLSSFCPALDAFLSSRRWCLPY